MMDDNGIPAEVNAWIGRQLIKHVPANIIVINRDFEVVKANSNFSDMFGDTAGKRCFEIYKKRNTPCIDCMAEQTFKDGQVRVRDESGIDKAGRPAHFVVHAAPVYNEVGEINYIIEMSYDVTESKTLQRQYNLLFERVPCCVSVLSRDMKIVRANELFRKTFSDKEGEYCYNLYKHCNEQCEDCPIVKTFNDGGSYTTKMVGLDSEGRSISFIVSTAPLSKSGEEFDHVIHMSIDVTEADKLYDELVQERGFRSKLIESAIDALVTSDVSGKVNIFNPAAEKLFGVSADEVLGKREIGGFLPRKFHDEIRRDDKPMLIPDTTVTDSNGEEIPVRFSSTTIFKKGEVIGGAVFLQDLREYKKLEKENLDNERLAAVGQTVAQLAHGIKNILTGLQGGMYVIKSGIKKGNAEKTNKGWEMLERNIERITTLVKGFLSFSKGHVPDVKPTDPAGIARDVFELFKDAAEGSGVTLLLEIDDEIEMANIDSEGMSTCLENLVSNAIDACKVSEREKNTVTIRVGEKEGVIVYEVYDTGSGMDYEIKNKVFTTFFTTKGLGGTGLGLMTTRKIVQEHGGKISVESKEGGGSVFRIKLPRKRLPEPDAEARGE